MWKNRIIMIVLIILSAVFVSFYGGPIPYALFFFFLFLPLLSYLYLLYVYNRFRVYQLLDKKTLVKHEKVAFRFILANEDFITYSHICVTFLDDYSTLEQVDRTKSYTLLPGEKAQYETALICRYCGNYRVGIDKIILEDYFHLFRLSYKCPAPLEVHVLPRVLHPMRLPRLTAVSETFRSIANERSSSLDAETRNYQAGDSTRSIHWKILARHGQLMTRKSLPDPKQNQTIFLDLALPLQDYDDYIHSFDLLAECVLAVANYYLTTKTPCTIYTDCNGPLRFTIDSQTDLESLYTFFSETEHLSGTSIGKLINSQSVAPIEPTHCILITTTPNTELFLACMQLMDRGNSISLLSLSKDPFGEFTGLSSERFSILRIEPDEELLSVLESN